MPYHILRLMSSPVGRCLVLLLLAASPGLAATFLVTNLADSGPGSLRQAIAQANVSAGADVVEFSGAVTGSIVLASALPAITDEIQIVGPGAGAVTVSGGGSAGIFQVASGAGEVTISGLTLRDGRGIAGVGGCLAIVSAAVEVSGVHFVSCQADSGGAIHGVSSPLTIVDSEFHFCRANAGSGGGLMVAGGGSPAVEIDDSWFRSSRATVEGGAMAMLAPGGSLTVTDSALVGNIAGSRGGGLFTQSATSVANTTFKTNTAAEGGGIGTEGVLALRHVTLIGNRGQSDHGGLLLGPGGTIGSLGNSIFAYNVQGATSAIQTPSDCSGDLGAAGGHNLDTDGSCGFDGAGDLPATDPLLLSFNTIDPRWAPFIDPRSPAVDAGAAAACLPTDQRGVPRPLDGDVDGIAACDLGAFEARSFPVAVTTDAGPGSLRQAILDANAAQGRDYVVFTDAFLTGSLDLVRPTSPLPAISESLILRGPGLLEGGIDGGDPAVGQLLPTTALGGDDRRDIRIHDLTLTGGSAPGAPGGGVMNVREGEVVVLERCHLHANGSAADGGAFSVQGNLDIRASVLTSNQATGKGGAIATVGTGSVGMGDSRLDDNRALLGDGGAVHAGGAQLTIVRSSLSSNRAGGNGGAVAVAVAISAAQHAVFASGDSTFSGNQADGDGGAIFLEDVTPGGDAAPWLELLSLTIADNRADADADLSGSGDGIAGSLPHSSPYHLANSIFANSPVNCALPPGMEGGYNIATDSSCGLTNVGDRENIDPLISPLTPPPALGSRSTTRFHFPRAGSPAIDGASVTTYPPDFFGCFARDQSGASRHVDHVGPPSPFLDGDGDGFAACDVGAVEVLFANGFEAGFAGWSSVH